MDKIYSLKTCRLFLLLVVLWVPYRATGQCIAWSATAQLTAAATCAANGSFTVTLLGPDAANLTNIRYGIPISPNGFSVPLNGSPNFSGIRVCTGSRYSSAPMTRTSVAFPAAGRSTSAVDGNGSNTLFLVHEYVP